MITAMEARAIRKRSTSDIMSEEAYLEHLGKLILSASLERKKSVSSVVPPRMEAALIMTKLEEENFVVEPVAGTEPVGGTPITTLHISW